MIGLVSVAEMRALEERAFAAGTTEAALQERAGTAVAEEVLRLSRVGQRVIVMVGKGNNGRDGMVAGRWLLRRGVPVSLVLTPGHAVTPDELTELSKLGGLLTERLLLSGDELVIDALLGIGARGALREPLASLARTVNTAGAFVVALDIPSGIDADSGAVEGEAIRAQMTVTLGAVKQGLLRFPAAAYVGRLIVREIGLSREGLTYACLQPADLRALLPGRPLNAHKYRFGRVLVLAGSDQYLGAPVLCAGAALRSGAGLVTVGSSQGGVRQAVAAHFPEATYVAAGTPLSTYLESHNALVIGPGLGRSVATTDLVASVLGARGEGATVVDADALFALTSLPDWSRLVGAQTVLTPHAGELQRLVGHEVEEPLWFAAAQYARRWGCVLIAKGPFTCVAAPSGEVAVWPHANPLLATGGTGDVLAGLCAGLLAQGLAPFAAAQLAVGVHALCAERLARSRRTLLASDLIHEIPTVLHELA